MAAKRRPSYLSPFAFARRNAIYKGLLGGERKWLVIGGGVWGLRFLRKALGKTEEVVTVERLEPGQAITLRAIPQATRRQRKITAQENKLLAEYGRAQARSRKGAR